MTGLWPAAILLATQTLGLSSAPPSEDPLTSRQYGLAQAGFPAAWSSSTGTDVVIAVIDTGVDLEHPDLSPALVPGYDFIEDDDRPQDENGHGTHVAGIAAAVGGNGIGGSGAAPAAKIMPIRVLDAMGSGEPAVITTAIGWAVDHGATVINLSLGGDGPAARLLKGGQLNPAIRAAADRGAVVVAAAGNDGRRSQPYRLAVPVVVVNAVDANGEITAFSNYGDARAVAAAGADVLSTTPRQPSTLFPQGTSGYNTLSGTSMAAPLVAAEAALLLAQGRTGAEVLDIVASTTRNPTGDPRLGAGVIDAAAAVAAASTGQPVAAAQPGATARAVPRAGGGAVADAPSAEPADPSAGSGRTPLLIALLAVGASVALLGLIRLVRGLR